MRRATDSFPLEAAGRAGLNESPIEVIDRLVETIEQLYLIAERSSGWEQVVGNLLQVLESQDGVGDEARHPGLDRVLSWLTPHLTRVLMQQAARDRRSEVETFQDLMLDRHPFGMALYRVNGELLWANATMQARLQTMDQHALQRLVGLHARRPARLDIESLSDGEPSVWLALDVHAMGPTCVALLVAPGAGIELSPSLLRDLYRLTPAEAAIARQLALGDSAEEIAQAHGTSLQTVRGQIKAVMAKLDVHRQGEAVSRLLSGPAWLDTGGIPPVPGDPAATAPGGFTFDLRGQPVGVALLGPKDGRPVLFMHSWAGSRLQPPQDEAPLHRYGVRLIVIERPGHGLSAPLSMDPSPLATAHAMGEVARGLGIAGFDVLGYSLGAIFALACAKVWPQRVARVHLVCPVAPLKSMSDLRGMLPSGRLLLALAMKAPSLASPLVRLWMGQMRRRPELYLESVFPHLAPRDAAIMRTPSWSSHYTRSFVEAIYQGDDAVVREIQLLASDWSQMLTIAQPVQVWHGECDSHVPIKLSQRLARDLPDARLETVPRAGHYLLYHQWDAIIEAMGRRGKGQSE